MRLVHLSDLHYYVRPSLRGVFGKRLIGLANLYLRGRIHQFSPAVAASAFEAIAALEPDGVLLTGDLTALGSPGEFARAREALEPLLTRFPTFIVPGNHDHYTRNAHRTRRAEQYFGPWMRSTGPAEVAANWPSLHQLGDVAILGIDPCRFTLASDGRVPEEQLARLEDLLQRPEVMARFRILMMHYPLMNRLGEETRKLWRRLYNGAALWELLERHPVHLVVHGHDHLRYLNHLRSSQGVTYLYNSGSAAFSRGFESPIPASFNLYHIAEKALVWVEHHDFRPEGWVRTFAGPPPQSRWSAVGFGEY